MMIIPNQRLTGKWSNFSKRWFNLPEKVRQHKDIGGLIDSPCRFNIVAAGRRSFKTETRKRKIIIGNRHFPGALTFENGNFFVGCPTREQVKRIYWNDLKTMTQPFWSRRPSETELVIHLITGSRIFLLGMDKPERIEGPLWHGGVLDEYANMRPNTYFEHVHPVTMDTGAWIDFIGVPEGKNHFYDLYLDHELDTSGNWGVWTWESEGVIPDSELKIARETLDERTYCQEIKAQFLSGGSIVYYSFQKENIAKCEFDPNMKVYMTWDFNTTIKPMCVNLLHNIDGLDYCFNHFNHQRTNTESMCEIILDYFKEHNFRSSISVSGDYTGTAMRSSATKSDYNIISHFFKNYGHFEIKTKPVRRIKNRTTSLNARFRSYDGKRHMMIDPRLTKLIKDIQQTEWRDNGIELDDSISIRTHPSDSLSYYAYNHYPAHMTEASISVTSV